MLAHLSSFDTFLWLTIAAAQIALAAVLLWRGSQQRYPAFTAYVCFAALKSLGLIAIPSGNPWLYFWAYYASSVVTCVLIALAVGEIYMYVFGPKIALPSWVPRNVAAWLAGAVSSCAILAITLKPLGPNKYMVLMGGIQAALVSALLLSLIIMILYSRSLGIRWRSWQIRITSGFVIFLSINSTTIFVLGLASREAAGTARRMGQLSYLASLVWWGCALYGREHVPEKATREQVIEMQRRHRETMEAVAQTATRV